MLKAFSLFWQRYERLGIFALLLGCALCLFYIRYLILLLGEHIHYWIGWRFSTPVESSFSYFYLFFGLVLATLLAPLRLNKPSDYFLIIYAVLTVLPKLALPNLYVVNSLTENVIFLLFLTLPIFLLAVLWRVKIALPALPILGVPHRQKILSVAPYLFALAVLLFVPFTAILGFDMQTHYERRLFFREITAQMPIWGYVMGSLANGILPLAMFIAVGKRHIFLGLCVGLIAILIFGVNGVKFHFFSIGIAALVAALLTYRDRLGGYFVPLIFALIFFGLLFTTIAFSIAPVSLGDTILSSAIRRLFFVPPYVMEAHLHFFELNSISLLHGYQDREGLLRGVGEMISWAAYTRANTHFLLIALLNGGVGFALLTFFLLYLWVAFADWRYRVNQNPCWLWLGCAIALVGIEQEITIMVLSSGLGLVSGLILLYDQTEPARRFAVRFPKLRAS